MTPKPSKKKPRLSIMLSSSILKNIAFHHGARFTSKKTKSSGAAKFAPMEYPIYETISVESAGEIRQFVFSGWKFADGLTEEMATGLKDETVGAVVSKVFVVGGLNDIR